MECIRFWGKNLICRGGGVVASVFGFGIVRGASIGSCLAWGGYAVVTMGAFGFGVNVSRGAAFVASVVGARVL